MHWSPGWIACKPAAQLYLGSDIHTALQQRTIFLVLSVKTVAASSLKVDAAKSCHLANLAKTT